MKLVTDHLTKTYNRVRALDGFSHEFTPGIYGLLGPNGAGKSTLMNLITDNLRPTSGEILYDGEPIRTLGPEYRRKVGFMPQQQTLYPAFTVERFLWYMAGLKGLDRKQSKEGIESLLASVNLTDVRRRRLGELSGGMKQRVLLAQALLGKPEIIILDEPTAGLDPKERIRMRNFISRVGFECIILIATHVVTDIQFIAKEVLIMGGGRIIDAGEPGALCSGIHGKVFEIETDDRVFEEVMQHFKVIHIFRDGDRIKIRVLSDQEPSGYKYTLVNPDLEDLYMHYFE